MASHHSPSSIPAVFFRGGTSNALMIHRSHLPVHEAHWEPILAGAMGSPDPFGRQLNGMGGGVSSLSKVCVIQKSERADADVDYTFVQLGILNGKMDLAGTCGNMTAAVGPFAIDEGLFKPVIEEEDSERMVTVRIFNTNTNKIIHSRFAVEGVNPKFKTSGGYSIDGVPGTGSRITLAFLSPGGSKTGRTLPTGNPVDILNLTGNKPPTSRSPQTLRASLVDMANPAVIILASEVGIQGDIKPDQLDNDRDTMELLEEIRKEGARKMGLDPSVESIPKMVLVSAPHRPGGNIDIVARTLSMGQTHKAIPLTIALNLGAACNIPGTLPSSLVRYPVNEATVTVGHPSGRIEVGAQMRDGEVENVVLHRTARTLMRGEVYWRQ